MARKLITTVSLLVALAAVALAVSAAPASATPSSPGACNMLHVGNSAVGFAGMLNSGNGQGLDNMVALVLASEAAGCSP